MKDQYITPTKTEKTRSSNARGIAFILLLPAVLSLVCAVWMAFQTMGTKLLFVTASKGQLYRQYPLFLIVGLLLLLVAVLLLRANPAQPRKEEARGEGTAAETASEAAATEAVADEPVIADVTEQMSMEEQVETSDTVDEPKAPEQEEMPAEAAVDGASVRCFCTNCGAELAPESKFCMKCGTPVPAEEAQS